GGRPPGRRIRPRARDGCGAAPPDRRAGDGRRVKPLALVGPTASGKTEASLWVGRALRAEILSVDSMVVYRGMGGGTAQATREEQAAIPHHLIDIADPAEAFSVADYQRQAMDALADVERAGYRALLVGGSGLYYRAIVDRLEFPGTEQATRALLEAEAAAPGADALYRRLADTHPAAAAPLAPASARPAPPAGPAAAWRWPQWPAAPSRAARTHGSPARPGTSGRRGWTSPGRSSTRGSNAAWTR